MKLWKKITCAVLYAALACFLFLTRPCEVDEQLSLFFLALTVPFGYTCLFSRHPERPAQALERRSNRILLGLISLYASFACFGWFFFSLGETVPVLTWDRWGYWLLGAAWWYGAALALLCWVKALSTRRKEKPEVQRSRRSRILVWLVSFAVFACIQAFFALIFYPGGWYTDSCDVLLMATGDKAMTDWHPFMNALLVRLLLQFTDNLGVITLIQALGFAPLMASFVLECYDLGCRPVIPTVICALLLLLPNQVMESVCVQKDTPFTYALLGATLLFFRLVTRPEKAKKVTWILWMVLSLFAMCGLRHNGIAPALGFCIALAVMGILHLKKKNRRLGISLITAAALPLVLFGIWKGPVMKALDVAPNEQSSYIFALNALGACANQGEELSEQTTAWMEEIQPLSDWAECYDRYTGHDAYVWSPTKKVLGFDTSSVTLSRALSMYLDALSQYPVTVITDRLGGSNIVWTATRPKESSMKWHSYFVWEDVPEEMYAYPFKTSLPQYLMDHWKLFYQVEIMTPTMASVPDMFLWRGGIWLILLYILLLHWRLEGMNLLLPAASGTLMHVLTSYVIIYYQDTRYIWAIQLLTVALIGLTIAYGRTRRNHEQQLSEN